MFHTKSLAEENGGIPVLAWIFILLAFALFVGFVVWWYRRRESAVHGEAASPPQPAEIELPTEIELPVTPVRVETGPALVADLPPEREPVDSLATSVLPISELPGQEQPAAPDDLVILEGIGPKIAAVLQSAGICTFAQLAGTEVSRLKDILVAAHLQFIDPASWPEQAALAAAGDWDGLENLTAHLRGGRRVS